MPAHGDFCCGLRTNDTSADRRTFLKAVGGAGVASVGSLSLVDRASAQGNAITFGQPASLTGKWDDLQPAVSQSTDLALSEINEAGGPLGRQANLQRRDTTVDPQQARQVVQQLINNDGSVAILGLFSSEITPLFDFLTSQQVPIVTPWPGSTALDERGGDKGTPQDLSDDGWIWRTVIGDTVHTIGAAKKLLDEDMGRVGIMNGTSQGERSWADAFERAYTNGDGTVAARVEVEEGKSTYQSELNRLFGNDFDAWALAVALEDAVTITREWSSAGYGKQLLLEDGLRDQNLIDNAGQAADGAWLAAATGQGPGYDSFIEKFRQAGDADVHPWGVAAYDATNVAALAIERADEREAEVAAWAEELVDFFDLGGLADEYAAHLSGGQRKLLEFARALMLDPDLLLLDEPLAGVNPTLARKISGYVERLNDEGTTLLVVEHEIESLAALVDRLVVLHQGRVLAEGTPEAVLEDERVVEAYLGG